MNKGFIRISDELYKNEWCNIFVLMKDFRPTHIEFRHWENDVWYIYGVSDLFDEIKECEQVPQYEVVFNVDNQNKFIYKFKRSNP